MMLNDPVWTRTAITAMDGAQTPAPPTVETYSAFGRDYAVLRQSAPMKIGRHNWRLSMLRRKRDSRPFVDAEFRRNDGREHTSRTPCGPLHFDGRLWREAGDWPGKQPPKRLAVLIDATPWARMRPILHALLDAAERREWIHDARTKWQAPTLLADERHGLPRPIAATGGSSRTATAARRTACADRSRTGPPWTRRSWRAATADDADGAGTGNRSRLACAGRRRKRETMLTAKQERRVRAGAEDPVRKRRQVRLVSRRSAPMHRYWRPTAARWSSFGWKVLEEAS